jgi:hypothetical protein
MQWSESSLVSRCDADGGIANRRTLAEGWAVTQSVDTYNMGESNQFKEGLTIQSHMT